MYKKSNVSQESSIEIPERVLAAYRELPVGQRGCHHIWRKLEEEVAAVRRSEWLQAYFDHLDAKADLRESRHAERSKTAHAPGSEDVVEREAK